MVYKVARVDSLQKLEPSFSKSYQANIEDCLTQSKAIDPPFIPTRIELVLPEDPIKEEMTASQLARLATILFRCQVNRQENIEQQILFKTEGIIHQKQLETNKLLEAAQKVQNSTVWDYLKMVAGILLGTVAILVGSTAFAFGGPLGWTAGSLMIGSGLTSISTAIMAQLKVHPEITSIVSLASAGLGIAGSLICFWNVPDSLTNLVAVIANAAFTVASGTATIGSEEMKRQLALLDYDITMIKKELALDDATVKHLSIQAMQIAETMYNDIRHCQIALAKQQQVMKNLISLQTRG